MQGLLIFAGFMVLWKAMDTFLTAYQLYLQAKLEEGKDIVEVEPEKPEEDRKIGFQDYSSGLLEVEED